MRQLIWLRSDLRLHDNTALSAAMAAGPTLAVYLISPEQGTHLYLRHRTTRLHLQGFQAGADPPAGHFTLLRVVARQRRVALFR